MAVAMVGALGTTIVVVALAVLSDRAGMPMSFAARLQATLQADAVVAAWLAAAIANVARLRFFSERDISGSAAGPGSAPVPAAQAVLQNTLEQACLAITAHLAVTAAFGRTAHVVTALACLFAVGRLLFWTGYGRGAGGRAFGFALTFYPSVLALVAALCAMPLGRMS